MHSVFHSIFRGANASLPSLEKMAHLSREIEYREISDANWHRASCPGMNSEAVGSSEDGINRPYQNPPVVNNGDEEVR